MQRSEVIAKKVKELTKAGVQVKDIFGVIQRFQDAPRSNGAFYKTYGQDMAEARAEIALEIGNTVIQQAKAGDFKSQQLYLTTKGGWNTTAVVQEQSIDDPEECDRKAIDKMSEWLGLNDAGTEES